MSELFAAEKWLYTVLAADASLTAVVSTRIYNGQAPQSTATTFSPTVVFQMLSVDDRRGVGSRRIWANTVYIVRGIAEEPGFGGNLLTIADRIDAVLHIASGSNVNGTILDCVRERPFEMTETVDGRTYRHLGGVYRLLVQ